MVAQRVLSGSLEIINFCICIYVYRCMYVMNLLC
jgi:hypothetical protein